MELFIYYEISREKQRDMLAKASQGIAVSKDEQQDNSRYGLVLWEVLYFILC